MWSIQSKVQSLFYRHGMFCASHPFAIISMVITIACFTCYPLTKIPLPGNAPLMYKTPTDGYEDPPSTQATPTRQASEQDSTTPRWYVGSPQAYIQQIIIKSAVSSWDSNRHIQTDAFRAPLSTAFDIREKINNFRYKEGDHVMSLSDLCFQVTETQSKLLSERGVLPEYNCLYVSLADFWRRDKARFDSDADIMKTIFKKYGTQMHTPPYLKDVLFGLAQKDTGVKKFFVRNRQRVISFAVTIVLKEYNQPFVSALKEYLHTAYPLSVSNNKTSVAHLVHIYYKDLNYFVEYTPLLVTYAVLFMYIYFSVRKIEMVKSKWGLAFSAVVTVIASLLMSVSICLLFGLTPSLNGSEIFPYLVVIIGLENVLVVTKSVVSTPVYLDVKLRVAQGISKEGWYIFKYMVTELFILAIGFLTFVPAIQEFCAFAVVGLLTDFFLQMFFFTTVLSIDIRRMELSDFDKKYPKALQEQPELILAYQNNLKDEGPVIGSRLSAASTLGPTPMTFSKTRSPLRIPSEKHSPSSLTGSRSFTYDPVSPGANKLPRRVRFFNFWARTRVVQKTVMVCVVIWILLIVYKAGILMYLTHTNGTNYEDDTTYDLGGVFSPTFEKLMKNDNNGNGDRKKKEIWEKSTKLGQSHGKQTKKVKFKIQDEGLHGNSMDDENSKLIQGSNKAHEQEEMSRLKMLLVHEDGETWKKLSYKHWPTLFGYYNISLQGKYITILPTIHLSISVGGDEALSLRHPEEPKLVSKLSEYYNEVNNIAGSFMHPRQKDGEDHINHSDQEGVFPAQGPNKSLSLEVILKRFSVYPSNTFELILTVLCCGASIVMFFYFMVFLYKCMCPKNYSEWRASWYKSRKGKKGYYKQIRETVPMNLEGHKQEIECVTTDGPLVISACLGGIIKIWDGNSAECITTIHRQRAAPPMSRNPIPGRNIADSDADLYMEYHGDDPELGQKKPPHEELGSAWGLGQSPPARASLMTLRDQGHRMTRQYSFGGPLDSSVTSPTIRRAKHTRYKSADLGSKLNFEDLGPDLSVLIDTNFSLQSQNVSGQRSPTPSCQDVSSKATTSTTTSTSVTKSPVSNSVSSLEQGGRNTSPVGSYEASLPNSNNSSFSLNASSLLHDSSSLNQSEPVTASSPNQSEPVPASQGFSFQFVEPVYREHQEFMALKKAYLEEKKKRAGSEDRSRANSFNRDWDLGEGWEDEFTHSPLGGTTEENGAGINVGSAAPVWCLACHDNLIVAGCGDGAVEFWDGLTGQMKCHFSNIKIGVTAVCFVGNKIMAARLNGTIDFLEIETFVNQNKPATSQTRTLHNRGHVRTHSNSFLGCGDFRSWDDVIHCTLITTARAHQKPIHLLKSEGGRVVSGSQDHTLKVYRLEDSLCLYTLYGHNGTISSLYLDSTPPLAAASGSEDGTVRLWDLFTGACVHKLHGHRSTVSNVTCTAAYVISMGVDDRLCVWERTKGALLHWVQMEPGFCNSIAMLSSTLMVSGGQGCMYLWDVAKGEILRAVRLGDADHSVFVNQIHVIANAAVVCDYGNQLRVVQFKSVLEKAE